MKTEIKRIASECRSRKGWGDTGGIQAVNHAGQIDQLNALRFKMKSWKFNSTCTNSVGILESETPGARWGNSERKTYRKYGGADRGDGVGSIGKNRGCVREPFAGIPDGGSIIGWIFDYTVGIKSISLWNTKTDAYVEGDMEIRFQILRK